LATSQRVVRVEELLGSLCLKSVPVDIVSHRRKRFLEGLAWFGTFANVSIWYIRDASLSFFVPYSRRRNLADTLVFCLSGCATPCVLTGSGEAGSTVTYFLQKRAQ